MDKYMCTPGSTSVDDLATGLRGNVCDQIIGLLWIICNMFMIIEHTYTIIMSH